MTTYLTKFFNNREDQERSADDIRSRLDLSGLVHTINFNVTPTALDLFKIRPEIKDALVELPKMHREGIEIHYANNTSILVGIYRPTEDILIDFKNYLKYKLIN